MQNVTLCMRTWCEVRNFSSQKFRLTPDRKQPTVFDIITCMRVWNRLSTFCYTDMSSLLFSPDDRMRTLMFLMLLDLHSCLPNLYLHKKTDLTGFVKIKPRHQDGLKKTDLGGKTQQWEPQCCQLFSQKIYQIIS